MVDDDGIMIRVEEMDKELGYCLKGNRKISKMNCKECGKCKWSG